MYFSDTALYVFAPHGCPRPDENVEQLRQIFREHIRRLNAAYWNHKYAERFEEEIVERLFLEFLKLYDFPELTPVEQFDRGWKTARPPFAEWIKLVYTFDENWVPPPTPRDEVDKDGNSIYKKFKLNSKTPLDFCLGAVNGFIDFNPHSIPPGRRELLSEFEQDTSDLFTFPKLTRVESTENSVARVIENSRIPRLDLTPSGINAAIIVRNHVRIPNPVRTCAPGNRSHYPDSILTHPEIGEDSPFTYLRYQTERTIFRGDDRVSFIGFLVENALVYEILINFESDPVVPDRRFEPIIFPRRLVAHLLPSHFPRTFFGRELRLIVG